MPTLPSIPSKSKIPLHFEPNKLKSGIYEVKYKRASAWQGNLAMHWLSYILLHISLILICSVQNAMVFLICWELMAVSAFILVVFENYKTDTLKAGINYLI